MKKRFWIFYHHFLISLGTLLLIALTVVATVSSYLRHQKEKLNNLGLQQAAVIEQKIFFIKKRINKFNIKPDQTVKENSEKENWLTSIDFEQEVKKNLAQWQHQAFIKKISLPNNIFSIFEQKYFLSENTEKQLQVKQKQWILIKNIFEKILLFPKSKIEQFDLKEEPFNPTNNSLSQLGTLVISLTMQEDQFQKSFNQIVCDNHFIISSVNISNSNPLPPPHHYLSLKDSLLPILGNEVITTTLRINLFDITYKNNPSVSNVEWKCEKTKPLLFVSRHYAVKNETLIEPTEYPQTLCPPIPNDWLVLNGLDYSNPNILFEDIDHTGFNNLEKWQGDNPQEEPGKFSSDPNDPTSHPLLWTKLRCHQKEIISQIYSLYFLGFQINKQEKLFQIQPNIELQTTNIQGKVTFNKKIRCARMGEQIEGIPYKIVNYQEERSNYKKTYYDSSKLTLEHLTTKQQTILIKKTSYHPLPEKLTNITSIKLENTIFNPPQEINLKWGDHFTLEYVLPNEGWRNPQNVLQSEDYQLVDINNNFLTIRKDSHQYKIPIILEK